MSVTQEVTRKICRHCNKIPINRPRGLCWGCYYTPGVKDKYPSTSKYARRGHGNFCGVSPLPEEPTKAPPGSAAKVEILIQRCKAGNSLWHPEDAKDYTHVREEECQAKPDRKRSGSHWGVPGSRLFSFSVFYEKVMASDDSELDSSESESGDGEALE